MILFLDACMIIYWVEAKEPFYSTVTRQLLELKQKFAIQQIAVSRLSYLECRVLPLRHQNQLLLNKYDQFFRARDLMTVELSADIIERATHLRADHQLKTPDAIQAASALSLDTNIHFVTADAGFKKVPALQLHLIDA